MRERRREIVPAKTMGVEPEGRAKR